MDSYYIGNSASASESSSIRFDFRTFLVTVSLVAIGLISIYSATYEAGAASLFTSQFVFALGGLVAMIAVAFIPERWISLSVVPLYAVGLVLLLAVLFIGQTTNGQMNWINLGAFSLQPSELAKLGTLLLAAQFVSREGRDLKNWRDLGILAGIVMLPVALIFFEHDTGSMTVYIALLVGIALWAGADLFFLFSIAAPIVVVIASLFGIVPMLIALGVVLGVMLLFRRSVLVTLFGLSLSVIAGSSTSIILPTLPIHIQNRMATFLDPAHDPQGTGYHVIQSLMAVGSGGLTGKGFLQGTMTHLGYIPEQWTDFIYSVPTEEFGFFGGVLVLALMAGLIWFAVDTASHLRDRFASTICFGIAAILLYHTTINIGMAVGLVPVMGIPLPFLSKGGSSLLLNMSMVGLLLNFYRYRTDMRR
jgi:rod shape determining protein RodA